MCLAVYAKPATYSVKNNMLVGFGKPILKRTKEVFFLQGVLHIKIVLYICGNY